MPVVAYFVKNGSSQYLLQETIGQGLSRIWNGRQVGFGLAEISPEQYGLIAIHELKDRGHEMLSEFEIVDGTAFRKQFTRTQSLPATAARRRSHGGHPLCRAERDQAAMARAADGPANDQGCSHCARQQDRSDGLGIDDSGERYREPIIA
ncbi:MAG: hypothetical protein ABIK36_15200 [Pseudomonadota bacterium]